MPIISASAPRAMTPHVTTAVALSQGPLGSIGVGVLETARLGPLRMAWVGEGVARLGFGREPFSSKELRGVLGALHEVPVAPIPELVRDTLLRYLEGEPVDPCAIPVRLAGARFHSRVWQALRTVPRGSVRTYAQLAADVGSPRATRAVGTAMARNPIAIVVPCHRVIATGMRLGGYAGGLEVKRALLGLEDVDVVGAHVRPRQLDLLASV